MIQATLYSKCSSARGSGTQIEKLRGGVIACYYWRPCCFIPGGRVSQLVRDTEGRCRACGALAQFVLVTATLFSCCDTVGAGMWQQDAARKIGRRRTGECYDQKLATIFQRKVLCKQPGRYIGWPSIALAPNHDLLVVFSGDREAHVSPDGKTQMLRSTDGGKTWNDPVTINDLPIDDRDAGIVRTQQGTMMVSWFTGPPYHTEMQGHYVMRSPDNGHTWSKPIRTRVTTPHGPISLQNGRLLYLGLKPHCSHTRPDNYNGPPHDSPHTVSVEESRDDGKSWQIISTFPVPQTAKMLSFDEPHLVETVDGLLVVQFRDCNAPHRLWQSESADGGLTWSSPRQTVLHGYPPHLLRLSNGWLLSTYARRWAPFGEFACISRNNGRSWDVEDEIQLSHAFNGDLGYPATVQLSDSTLWTVYYEIDRPGEKPCLMGTYWKLNDLPLRKSR